MAIPGPYNSKKRKIELMTGYMGWGDINIQEELEKRFNVPVHLEHDANAGAIAQYWYDEEGYENDTFAYIADGQGVGAGIIVHGELLKGIYEIDKKKYLFGITSGKLYTSGVAEITYGNQQGVYYTNSEGIVQTGFQTIGKDKYYFNEEGKLQKGIVEVAGKKYLLGITSGKLYTLFISIGLVSTQCPFSQ